MSSNVQYGKSIELKVLSSTPVRSRNLKRRTPGLIRNTAEAVRNDIEMFSGFEDMNIENDFEGALDKLSIALQRFYGSWQ
ncbi:hypothetical protein BLOT_011451 [Blomia tropicalis]|nr:hypothetical protein BLOT_011451 [Blomia tropicalis]